MAKTSLISAGRLWRRRDRRLYEPPILIELDGFRYGSVDWSLGGFRIGGYLGPYQIGDVVPVAAYGELAGRMLGGTALATVVRLNTGARELAASFAEFRGNTWDQLEQLAVRRARRA